MTHLDDFLVGLTARLQETSGWDWTPPPEPEGAPDYHTNRLQPVTASTLKALGDPLTITRCRADIYQRAMEYLRSDRQSPLLIRVPAGVGKTHGMLSVVQELACDMRFMWCADRHDAFVLTCGGQDVGEGSGYVWGTTVRADLAGGRAGASSDRARRRGGPSLDGWCVDRSTSGCGRGKLLESGRHQRTA